MNIRRWMVLTLIIILSGTCLSCGKKSPEAKPQKNQSAEKLPSELDKMKTDLAKLGILLEDRKKTMTPSSEPIASLPNAKKEKKEEKKKEQESSTEWKEEMKLVRSLHSLWNALEPAADLKGLSKTTQEGIETNLSALTQAVEARKIFTSQHAANQVFGFFVDVETLFDPPIPPDIDRIRYHVTEGRLMGEAGNWTSAAAESEAALEIWRRVSYAIDLDRDILYQTEHSLNDFKLAVEDKDPVVTSIKADIVASNLDKIEKQLTKKAFKKLQQ